MAAAPTPTARAQADLDRALAAAAARLAEPPSPPSLKLDREAHVAFARKALKPLPSGYSSLGASRPWVLHWATHSLALLKAPLSDDPREASRIRDAIVTFLKACQCRRGDKGGFGGGPGQEPHLATTYAAAATLVTLGGEEALEACDRRKLASFLLSCIVKRNDKSDQTIGYGFRVCPGGESDVRGCYCALASAALLRLPPPADPKSLAEAAGLSDYLRDCQTVEGGLGGFPGGPEAHGGYAFCGAAAAALAAGGGAGGGDGAAQSPPLPSPLPSSSCSSSSPPALDARALLLWASRCQAATCGGFAGRTNKLVDGCYSWWQGALFGMMTTTTMVPGGGGDGAAAAAAGAAAAAVSLVSSSSPSSPSPPPSSFPPFDASKLPSLPGLPRLPEGVSKAPTATERIEEEVERGGGERGGEGAAAAALEEARAASKIRELLPDPPPPSSGGGDESGGSLYDPLGLQMWILAYCQEPSTEVFSSSSCSSSSSSAAAATAGDTEGGQRRQQQKQQQQRRFRGGGLRDKPGKPPDHYHTCYCLSGLSAAQQQAAATGKMIVGGEENRLERTHPLLNVVEARVAEAVVYFSEGGGGGAE